jgi:hypothetical protein
MNTTPSNTNYNKQTKKINRSTMADTNTHTDGPTFRSMSVMAPPPQPRFFHQEESLQKIAQPSLAAAAPPRDPSRPWIWKMTTLLPVPMFHPLERTAATIENVALDTATSRISNFMKSHSITCQYHSDQGFIDCTTDDQLQFVVQLWQGNNNGSCNKIIMEVQRRQGCCIQMQTIRHQLLKVVVHGESSRPAEPPTRSTCAFLATLLDQTTSLPPPPQGECLPTALSICRTLLQSKRLDENRLGLESLCTLTDPSKFRSNDADQACRMLLSDATYQGLLEKHFMQKEDDTMEYEHKAFVGRLHLLALKVLSQSLESVTQSSSRPLAIDLSSVFWRNILQTLYCNLQVASSRPLEASLSIRCLRLLQTLEPSTLTALVPSPSSLHECLSRAHQYGRDHSRSLEQESEQFMGLVQ